RCRGNVARNGHPDKCKRPSLSAGGLGRVCGHTPKTNCKVCVEPCLSNQKNDGIYIKDNLSKSELDTIHHSLHIKCLLAKLKITRKNHALCDGSTICMLLLALLGHNHIVIKNAVALSILLLL